MPGSLTTSVDYSGHPCFHLCPHYTMHNVIEFLTAFSGWLWSSQIIPHNVAGMKRLRLVLRHYGLIPFV